MSSCGRFPVSLAGAILCNWKGFSWPLVPLDKDVLLWALHLLAKTGGAVFG